MVRADMVRAGTQERAGRAKAAADGVLVAVVLVVAGMTAEMAAQVAAQVAAEAMATE